MNFSTKLPKLLSIFALCNLIGLNTQLNAAQYAEPGFILTSIKPLQLIVQDITQGVIESVALLPPGASPHAAALRPSDVKKIKRAKSIYWVGPQLESFLEKSFSKYPAKTHALAALGNAITPATAIIKQEPAHDEHEEHEGHEEHDEEKKSAADEDQQHDHPSKIHVHQYRGVDPHIWLSPEVALLIAQQIKEQTSLLYPQHSAQLEENYQRFKQSLAALDLQWKSNFSALRALGFLVFHDAYSRFIEHYQLNQIGALTINPARRPGAKHLAEIRLQIQSSQPLCIFSEPQFSTVAIATITRNTSLRTAELDPLATLIQGSDASYLDFLEDFAQRIIRCLGNA